MQAHDELLDNTYTPLLILCLMVFCLTDMLNLLICLRLWSSCRSLPHPQPRDGTVFC